MQCASALSTFYVGTVAYKPSYNDENHILNSQFNAIEGEEEKEEEKNVKNKIIS